MVQVKPSPFARSHAMVAVLTSVFSSGLGALEIQKEVARIQKLEEFKSRGKGGGHYPRASIGFGYEWHRHAQKSTKTYQPNGQREVARRLRQAGGIAE